MIKRNIIIITICVVLAMGTVIFLVLKPQKMQTGQQNVVIEVLEQNAQEIKEQDSGTISEKQPNIILLMSDDQGWGQAGYMGHPILQTPYLDQMVNEGAQLNSFYVTAPICAPTRLSVLTGVHPYKQNCFNVVGCRIDKESNTIAEILQQSGYKTAHFGKWHLSSPKSLEQDGPGNHGFGYSLSHPKFFDRDVKTMYKNGSPVAVDLQGTDTSDYLVEQAMDFIEKNKNQDKPLFVVVWYPSPHTPHDATDADKALYKNVSDEKQAMYGEITALDRSIGVLRDFLAQNNMSQDTIVWFNSDNGAQSKRNNNSEENGSLRSGKSQIYEGGIRVPAIVVWPGFIKKQLVTRPITTLDMLPTLLSFAGISNNLALDGQDVSSLLLEDNTDYSSQTYFFSYDNDADNLNLALQANTAVLRYPYKLVVPNGNIEKVELYNIEDDISEQNNIVNSYREITESLIEELQVWQADLQKNM